MICLLSVLLGTASLLASVQAQGALPTTTVSICGCEENILTFFSSALTLCLLSLCLDSFTLRVRCQHVVLIVVEHKSKKTIFSFSFFFFSFFLSCGV
jgi:hypothetical protein